MDGTAASTAAIPGGTGGLAVTSTSVAISSGTVTLSSVHTVTATAGTNPWSSAPSFNIPIVSVSSGLVQISGTPTVTATAATNPWSSAPGFNVPILSASSGLVQMLSSGPFLLSSAGISQMILPVISTAGYAPVTSSAGLMVAISSGTVTSTATTITSGTVTLSSAIGLSSGLVTLSSVHTVTLSSATSLSSGIVTFSSVPTVTATAGTNPWSSAPGFNVPVVTVSSGLILALGRMTVTTSGLSNYQKMSTGGAVAANMTTAPSNLVSYMCFNSSATFQAAKFYNTTAPTVGSTTGLQLTVGIPGSTGGGGANLALPAPGIYSSLGWSVVITANLNDTDTGAPSTNNIAVNATYQV